MRVNRVLFQLFNHIICCQYLAFCIRNYRQTTNISFVKNDCTVNIFLIFPLHILPTFNNPLVFFFQLYCSVLDPFHYNDMSGCRLISLKFLKLHLLICYWYQDSPFLFVCHLCFFGPLLCLPSPTIQTIQVSDKWDGIFWLSSVSWADWTFVSNVWVWLRTTVIWSVACHLWLEDNCDNFYGLWLVTFVWHL